MTNDVMTPVAPGAWDAHNRVQLATHLQRLRLVLQRHVLWLRDCWRDDALHDYRGVLISDAEADRLLRDDSSARLRFLQRDPACDDLSRTLAETDALLGERRPGDPASALDVIVERFGLNAFERDTLVLCLAPEIDPSFARLYSYVQDDPRMSHPTPHLAQVLFGEGAGAEPAAFLPGSALLRHSLVDVVPPVDRTVPRSSHALVVDGRIAAFLQGINRADERVGHLMTPLATVALPPRLDAFVRRATDHLGATPYRLANVVASDPGLAEAVAVSVCSTLGLRAHKLDVALLSERGEAVVKSLRLIERECMLLRIAPVIDAGEQSASLDHILDRLRVFMVLHNETPLETDRPTMDMEVPPLEVADRVWLWRRALGTDAQVDDAQLMRLARQFEFGPQAIGRSASLARGASRMHADDGNEVSVGQLWDACRAYRKDGLQGLGVRLFGRRGWDDIVLPDDAKSQLHEIAAQVLQRGRVYDEWGFRERLARGSGISALFAGPSGTGKTMAAEILAAELNLDLYRVDLAGVVSKYIGETEKNLQKVFAAAEEAGWILFFDEADALFGKRTDVKDSHDRYANIEVNYLLQRMEQYRGLAILATNRRTALDRAFLRRIRFVVDFPFPDTESRLRIWLKSFPKDTPVEALDFDDLARLELAGGNISNIAINAAFLAAARSGVVTMRDVLAAARREYAKLDRVPPNPLLAEVGT